MLKTGYKNGFVILMRWGMILLIQFDEKKERKEWILERNQERRKRVLER